MNMFSTKQKEDILTAVDTIIKVMPILETEDRDFLRGVALSPE